MLYEAGLGTLFLMINSQRTEAKFIDAQTVLHNTVADLETALAEIKTLGGLLPICSSCKKIRDDKGYWNPDRILYQQPIPKQNFHMAYARIA